MEPMTSWAAPPGAPGTTPATPDDVPTLRHPADAAERARLARAGLPRLLVVEGGDGPPIATDLLEDWVRAAGRPDDAHARRTVLLRRYLRRTCGLALDSVGLVRSDEGLHSSVRLSPTQRAILLPLVSQVGTPVGHAVVEEGFVAAGGAPTALRGAIGGLRRRLEGTGLALHVLRERAYLLELPSPASDAFMYQSLPRNNHVTTTTEPDVLY